MPRFQDHPREPSPLARKRFQFSMRGLLVFVGVFCALCALVFTTIRNARETHSRTERKARLKDIALALFEYQDVYRCYPAASMIDTNGNPQSWRMALAEFIGSSDLGRRYDFSLPWNDPKNLKVSAFFAHHFRCPSATQPIGSGITNYVMVVGQISDLRADRNATRGVHPNVIIIAEIANSDIHWTEPRDLTLDELIVQMNRFNRGRNFHTPGVIVLFGDPIARRYSEVIFFVKDSTDAATVRAMFAAAIEDVRRPRESNHDN